MGFLSLLKDQRDKGLRERNPITRLLRERYRPNRAHRPIAHVNERCLCPENRKDKGRALLAIRVTLSDAFLPDAQSILSSRVIRSFVSHSYKHTARQDRL
jgi:hypothetical protein